MKLQVRHAVESDLPAIRETLRAAFGPEQGDEIADLVDGLLQDPTAEPLISLVALADAGVIGYILFSTARIEGAAEIATTAILAPLAVHPHYQNRGIGGRLIGEGLEALKTAGVDLVFVLGHPDYYPRHGFVTAGDRGFEAPYRIPTEDIAAWMVQELSPGMADRVAGRVLVADVLDDPRHWRE